MIKHYIPPYIKGGGQYLGNREQTDGGEVNTKE